MYIGLDLTNLGCVSAGRRLANQPAPVTRSRTQYHRVHTLSFRTFTRVAEPTHTNPLMRPHHFKASSTLGDYRHTLSALLHCLPARPSDGLLRVQVQNHERSILTSSGAAVLTVAMLVTVEGGEARAGFLRNKTAPSARAKSHPTTVVTSRPMVSGSGHMPSEGQLEVERDRGAKRACASRPSPGVSR